MHSELKTVAFDAFGTLAYIQDPTNAYAWLLSATGTKFTPAIRAACMAQDLSFDEYVAHIAPTCSSTILQRAREMLQQELASVTLFEDSIATLTSLRKRGFEIAVVSNLAAPFAPPLQCLLDGLVDQYCFSFEVGAMKPDREIFDVLLNRMGRRGQEVLMVGDRIDADVIGAQRAGIRALLLDRTRSRDSRPSCINHLSELTGWLDD